MTENCILVQGTSITFISILKDIIKFNRKENNANQNKEIKYSHNENISKLRGKFLFFIIEITRTVCHFDPNTNIYSSI